MIPSITIDTIKYHGDQRTVCFVSGTSCLDTDAQVLEDTQHSVNPGIYAHVNSIHELIGALLAGLEDSPATAEEVLNTLGDNLRMQVG